MSGEEQNQTQEIESTEAGHEDEGGAPIVPPEAEGLPEADLAAQLAAAEALAAEYLDGWQRARAELANYKKRVERERAVWGEITSIEVIAQFLPILDDFERALESPSPETQGQPWLEGITMIYRKLLGILEALNVTEIEAEGQFFDPTLHEAITYEASDDHGEEQIIAVVQKGYMLNDKVVRPARVRVARPAE